MRPDPAHVETDKVLEKLERRVTKEYRQATKEIQKKLDDYLSKFKADDERWRKQVMDGLKTTEEWKRWRTGKLLIGKRWEEMRDTLAEDLSHANGIARHMIDETMPEVYAINHNYGTFEAETGALVDTSYTLYDRQTVERLMRDNPQLLPKPGKATSARIRAGLEKRWNKSQIQSVMIQSVLLGESIPKIAKRLADTVGEKNRKAAIRNARTMTTGAENAGRVDSYKRAKGMGIELRQQWMAVLDGRTRHAHRILDGQIAEIGEPFEVEGETIRYPGDPTAPAHLVYNCRCRLIAAVRGHERDLSSLGDRNTKNLGGLTYEEWKQGKNPNAKPPASGSRPPAQPTQAVQPAQTTPAPAQPARVESLKLKGVLSPKDYQAYMDKVNSSPVKPLYDKHADKVRSVTQKKNGGKYFRLSDSVEFDYATDAGMDRYSTLAHEYGHMIDYHEGRAGTLTFKEADAVNGTMYVKGVWERPSQSDQFLEAMRKDMETYKGRLGDVAKELLKDTKTRNATSGVQDALDGFFGTQGKGILPWGHGNIYYNKFYNGLIKASGIEKDVQSALASLGFDVSNQAKVKDICRQYRAASEAWANVCSAYTCGGPELDAIEKYMPETAQAFLRIIGGLK